MSHQTTTTVRLKKGWYGRNNIPNEINDYYSNKYNNIEYR